jgi:hypothetical protein
MRHRFIYQALTEDQISALDFYGEEVTQETMGLIYDLFNSGISLQVSIRIAFNSLKQDMSLDENGG